MNSEELMTVVGDMRDYVPKATYTGAEVEQILSDFANRIVATLPKTPDVPAWQTDRFYRQGLSVLKDAEFICNEREYFGVGVLVANARAMLEGIGSATHINEAEKENRSNLALPLLSRILGILKDGDANGEAYLNESTRQYICSSIREVLGNGEKDEIENAED